MLLIAEFRKLTMPDETRGLLILLKDVYWCYGPQRPLNQHHHVCGHGAWYLNKNDWTLRWVRRLIADHVYVHANDDPLTPELLVNREDFWFVLTITPMTPDVL